jgi:hypothetical protein
MALANTPFRMGDKSQQAVIQFERECAAMLYNQWNIREQLMNIDRAYMRENDHTKENVRARLSNKLGDSTKFQNVTVPIVMPQVESAVTYQTSVFLTGSPIFGVVASPDNEDIAMQYQAIIEENSIRGGWVQQFQMFFRDCFKYNVGIVEVTWDRIVTASVESDINYKQGKEGRPKEIIWQGNSIKRRDPYNCFWDSRYAPTQVYKDGEFIGYTELMSRIHLKKFIAELPDVIRPNIVPAFESGQGSTGNVVSNYYEPELNPMALLKGDSKRITTNWMAWAGLVNKTGGIDYRNLYEVTTLYARILPSDFDLTVPEPNTVQIWKFIIVNHLVVLYAERQTNAHANLPMLIGQSNEDGLKYQTKSLASNAQSFQEIASALVNSSMAARRRAISDRGIYDPTRISEIHINSDNPSAKIPMRPSAAGKPISEAYMPIPFNDNQALVTFQELPQILQMANTVNGQNQSKQGQFVKGNKTLHEYADVMSNANGRDQVTSLLFEAQVFTPLKEILKSNILQYQPPGDVLVPSQQAPVTIDPTQLRKQMAVFKLTDGLTPTDKAISSDALTAALQTIMGSPQVGAAYNIGPLFSYLMKTQNADLKPFEKSPQQQAYESAVQAWQQVVVQMITKNPQLEAKNYPPQPTPQQYGYDPSASATNANNPTPSSNQPPQTQQQAPAQQGAQ